MAGARELGEVHDYPAQDGISFDDEGYVLTTDGNGRVGKIAAAGAGAFAVNYVSSEDQDGVVQSLSQDDPVDTVRESAGQPVQADAETYTTGDDVYVSGTNAGRVSAADTAQERVGVVVEGKDLSGGAGKIKVAFNFN